LSTMHSGSTDAPFRTGDSDDIEFVPDSRGLDLLELMLAGALPLNRFFDAADARSVAGHGMLADGEPWSLSVTLDVPAHVRLPDSGPFRLLLRDPEGVPLALLPSARPWSDQVGTVHVAGEVQPMHTPTGRPFRRLRLPASDVRAGLGGRVARAFAVVEPPPPGTVPGPAQGSDQRQGHDHEPDPEEAERPILLFALVGSGQDPRPTAGGLVRALLDLLPGLPDGSAVVPLPLPAADHPDPGLRLLRTVVSAYGAELVDSPEHRPPSGTSPSSAGANAARDARRPRGGVVLFTGLSGSGKSTLAQALEDVLLERTDRTVTLLDGDLVRRHLSEGLGFSRADRDANVRRIGYVAAEVARHGGLAIAAPIAPYASTRDDVRRMVTAAGGSFLLVHVATPLDVCEARDRKGLYAKARAGELSEFTGVSDPYEEPADADLRLDTDGRSVADCVEDVVALMSASGLLAQD
jgi:sulfate adenylyltransferase